MPSQTTKSKESTSKTISKTKRKPKVKTVFKKQKIGDSGKSAAWIKRHFPDLDNVFKEFIYSEDCPNDKWKYEYENKNNMSGISLSKMVKILIENDIPVQIITFPPNKFK